jgi:hypothetical protein
MATFSRVDVIWKRHGVLKAVVSAIGVFAETPMF